MRKKFGMHTTCGMSKKILMQKLLEFLIKIDSVGVWNSNFLSLSLTFSDILRLKNELKNLTLNGSSHQVEVCNKCVFTWK